MRKTVIALGLVMTVLLAACDWGGTPPIPVVRVDDDAIDNTLTAPQVVVPKLTFDQHLRVVGTVSKGLPGVYDVYRIDFPADADYRIAVDCTTSANLEVDFFDDQRVFVAPAQTCSPGLLSEVVSGSGFFMVVVNRTIDSVEAPYDIVLELVAVP